MNKLIIIAAAAENNALGINNELPWHLPDDFKRFKTLTTGHKIIMGRKTLESFPKALPNRTHIVITRNSDYQPKFDCKVVTSIKDAVALTKDDAKSYIIGGGEIYKQSLDMASHIELTRIHATVKADTFFPEINLDEWVLIKEEYHAKDDKHLFDFTYLSYKRKN